MTSVCLWGKNDNNALAPGPGAQNRSIPLRCGSKLTDLVAGIRHQVSISKLLLLIIQINANLAVFIGVGVKAEVKTMCPAEEITGGHDFFRGPRPTGIYFGGRLR